MKTTATVAALVIALAGCTTPSSMYVGQDGKGVRCAAHGWGYMGIPMAQGIHDQCSADAKAAGLIPLAEAGSIGVIPSTEGSPIRILRVVSGSPAEAAGIRPGDFIIAADDQRLTNIADARRMFFGRVNTPVKVTYRSGGTDKTVTLIRYPVTSMQAAMQRSDPLPLPATATPAPTYQPTAVQGAAPAAPAPHGFRPAACDWPGAKQGVGAC